MFERLLGKIAAALNKDKIPYMVIGGQAVLVYRNQGRLKTSMSPWDWRIEGLPVFWTSSKPTKFRCLAPDVEEFAKKTMVVLALDPVSGIRIDFNLSYSEYERTAIRRAHRSRSVAPLFISLHWRIWSSTRWSRDARATSRDVESVLLKNPRYDAGFIRKTDCRSLTALLISDLPIDSSRLRKAFVFRDRSRRRQRSHSRQRM